jgi:hypothetical protein
MCGTKRKASTHTIGGIGGSYSEYDYRPPSIPFEFAGMSLQNDKYVSNKYTIQIMGDKGRSLILHRPKAGLLIPYSGILISQSAMDNKNKGPSDVRQHIVAGLIEGTYWNANPDLGPVKCCWPGAYVNEPTHGGKEQINCRIVSLNKNQYPTMPTTYEGYHNATNEMIFIEVMVSSTSQNVEALAFYNRIDQIEKKGKPRVYSYKAKLNHPESYAPQFGNHYLFCEKGKAIMQSLKTEWDLQLNDWEAHLREKEVKRTQDRRKNMWIANNIENGTLNSCGKHKLPSRSRQDRMMSIKKQR